MNRDDYGYCHGCPDGCSDCRPEPEKAEDDGWRLFHAGELEVERLLREHGRVA